jgi:hypothetical protein
MMRRVSVTPTARGRDVDSTDRAYDAHIRTETVDGERMIAVDIFDSSVKSSNRAHVESDLFEVTVAGAKEAQGFLEEYGFTVRVRPPQ